MTQRIDELPIEKIHSTMADEELRYLPPVIPEVKKTSQESFYKFLERMGFLKKSPTGYRINF
jgi:hypothetical protein